MPTFATMLDLRDTASFVKFVNASREPVQVMKSGERKMVVMSNELFERYECMERQLAFKTKIAEAEDDTWAGRVRPTADVQRDMRAKYDL